MAQSYLEKAAQREGKGDPSKTKTAFYKLQREHAEESGDQSTTDKIYKKLGKPSHNVDTGTVDKAILGGLATSLAIPELGAAKTAGSLGRAALGKAEGALAKKGAGAVTKAKPQFPRVTAHIEEEGNVAKRIPAATERKSLSTSKQKVLKEGSVARIGRIKNPKLKGAMETKLGKAPKQTVGQRASDSLSRTASKVREGGKKIVRAATRDKGKEIRESLKNEERASKARKARTAPANRKD